MNMLYPLNSEMQISKFFIAEQKYLKSHNFLLQKDLLHLNNFNNGTLLIILNNILNVLML